MDTAAVFKDIESMQDHIYLHPESEIKRWTDRECDDTSCSDLSSLKGMSLTSLNLDICPVQDLTPLTGMPLTLFVFTPKSVTKGMDVIRQMKSLQTIGIDWNSKWPAVEFWKRYDAGEFK